LQSPLQIYKRYRTLQTHKISALPIVILMPHSACNCRCVMCDIWKDNKNLKQLAEEDIKGLMTTLKKFGTQQVLMSGGEALLNTNFFKFCEILNEQGIYVTLLSTGLTLKKNAELIIKYVHDVIVSLDGDEPTHDAIRNIPGAFAKIKEGITAIRSLTPNYPITSRTVIHRLNYKVWPKIIDAAKNIGLDGVSFLPADVSSHAFNREMPWDFSRQSEIMISREELPELLEIIDRIISHYKEDFANGFIAESTEKIRKIYTYYSALWGMNDFPYKKCNAPWVSTVIEADGTVRPCFFHKAMGNIRDNELGDILNSKENILFRKGLDMANDETCKKCVCYLHLALLSNL